MPRQRKPIKMPGLNRPHPWRDGEDPIPCFTPKPPPQDGDTVPDELDDAAPCPACIAAPCACDADDDHDHDGEPCHACIAEEEE